MKNDTAKQSKLSLDVFYKEYARKIDVHIFNIAVVILILYWLYYIFSWGLTVDSEEADTLDMIFGFLPIILFMPMGVKLSIKLSRGCSLYITLYGIIRMYVAWNVSHVFDSSWLVLIIGGSVAFFYANILNKQYGQVLEIYVQMHNDSEIISNTSQLSVKQIIMILIPYIIVFLMIFGLVGLNAEIFFNNAQAAEDILRGYQNWYLTLIIGGVVSILLIIITTAVAIKFKAITVICHWLSTVGKSVRRQQRMLFSAIVFLFPILGACLPIFIIMSEDVPTLLTKVQADFQQIEDSQLETAITRLGTSNHSNELPKLILGDEDSIIKVQTCYSKDEIKYLYVPDALVSLLNIEDDTIQYYQVTYTSNYHFVVSITPIDVDYTY